MHNRLDFYFISTPVNIIADHFQTVFLFQTVNWNKSIFERLAFLFLCSMRNWTSAAHVWPKQKQTLIENFTSFEGGRVLFWMHDIEMILKERSYRWHFSANSNWKPFKIRIIFLIDWSQNMNEIRKENSSSYSNRHFKKTISSVDISISLFYSGKREHCVFWIWNQFEHKSFWWKWWVRAHRLEIVLKSLPNRIQYVENLVINKPNILPMRFLAVCECLCHFFLCCSFDNFGCCYQSVQWTGQKQTEYHHHMVLAERSERKKGEKNVKNNNNWNNKKEGIRAWCEYTSQMTMMTSNRGTHTTFT